MRNSLLAETVEYGTDVSLDVLFAALEGDTAKLRKTAASLAQSYNGPDRDEVRKRLHELLNKSPIELRPIREPDRLPVDMKSRVPLLQKQEWPTDPLILDDALASELELALEEFANANALAQAGLGSRNAMLLHGEPGTGKSLIASYIAMRLGRPLLAIRLDTVISSLLGDTAKNIRALFEYAISSKAVLFLDEVDAVAKKRDDQKELGELKRVVNALLQGLDLLDCDTVVVAATNHAHMLDSAIWRRFPFQYEVLPPSEDMRAELWRHYLFEDAKDGNLDVLAKISSGLTGSDIKEISHAARRRSVITNKQIPLMSVVAAVLESRPGEILRPSGAQVSTEKQAIQFHRLNTEFGFSQFRISQIAGVSRQFVSKLLKSLENNK